MSELTSRLKTLHQDHMEAILAQIEATFARTVGADSSLAIMTRYHLSTGGKRLRALLPLATAEALGADPATLVPFGAACEILHNATLVHDDLQDGDRVRRGKPTVWVEYGMPQAINLGDAMLYATLLLVDELDAPLAARHKAQRRVLTETLRVVDGQEREFALKMLEHPDADAYFQMVEGKTSGLFALPVVGAAELCGLSEALCQALQEATRHLGVIFQIQDDILDLYGDKGREAPGSDIGEGKISMLVISALQRAEEQDARWLRDLLRREREQVSQEDVARASALFLSCGALQAAFDEIDARNARATSAEVFAEAPGLLALLRGMADVFMAPIEAVRGRLTR